MLVSMETLFDVYLQNSLVTKQVKYSLKQKCKLHKRNTIKEHRELE
jgi:hypothetical protein